MLGKRKSSRPIAPVKKRRKGEAPIEEITFDFGAREEYLTGFHKRKLQRIKHAKEEAVRKEREEKVAARKVIRENRRVDREKHVEAVNAAVRGAEGLDADNESSDGSIAHWDGIGETEEVDHKDEYLDEDRHTVVTVEAVDITRDGLQRKQDDPDMEGEDAETGTMKTSEGDGSAGRIANGGRTKGTKQSKDPHSWPKKKKKKFRYESKAERKVTRFKERSGGKAKAKARRE